MPPAIFVHATFATELCGADHEPATSAFALHVVSIYVSNCYTLKGEPWAGEGGGPSRELSQLSWVSIPGYAFA